jgi:hypothetical protein
MTTEQILADYPHLEADDLKAACAYGARLSQVKRIAPVPYFLKLWNCHLTCPPE